jgi:predicted MFS family arabinose efflux permease
MTLCVFALIASEFMPVSLLTPLAADLHVSEGVAGQGIAISGAFAVLTSLSITWLAGSMDRKTLLLILTSLMAISVTVVALAPSFAIYMVGRALIGVVIGGFWSMSAATAMCLVPDDQVPKALAIFNGGNALATVIAAPLGSYLGSVVGWRGAFLCLVPVAVVALVWQCLSLPSMKAQVRKRPAGNVFRLLGTRSVAFGMTACGAFFMGQFALFTYLRPFLETVTQVDTATLSLLLLVIGSAGLGGTLFIGPLLKKNLYRTLVAIPLLMAVIAITLIPAGGAVAPVGWWSWLAQAMPNDAEAGGGLMVAVVQFAIASGSMLGGWLFDHSGYQSSFTASAALLLFGMVMTLLAMRAQSDRR